ncbi:hypothetical protein ACFU5P_30735 [Streptomyces sp. NPDC057433]|uniref:hypothetical protein n=1 Tax=Streptomyces sp. NPDC057433 TaxID=3346132 RepID=UPI0036C0A4CB
MEQVLAGEPDEACEAHEARVQARAKEHCERLDAIVVGLLTRRGRRLCFDEVVHHDDHDALFRLRHGAQVAPST